MKRRSFFLVSLVTSTALAQAPQAPPRSPVVHPDRRVTFRFRAPKATSVLLSREGAAPLPMEAADEQGVWTVTTPPLEPDFYGYSFVADGVRLIDPSNPLLKPNLIETQSVVHVPGPASLPWEISDVPRGTVHRHFYRSGGIADDRDYYVYTPPGYERGKARYPVLYLLHGFSDDARGWTDVGRAHVILDNLIARGKAKPMLVVMPLGYGAPEMLAGWSAIRDDTLRRRSYDRFRGALLDEVMPAVEKTYRVANGREATAIAGLSMGGAQSLYIGLNARARFAWIGAFSTGGMTSDDYGRDFPTLDEKAGAELRLLWIACGTEDFLIDSNRRFREWLKGRKVPHESIETAGGHTWMVWRRNLAEFVPRLFQQRGASASR